MESGDVTSFVSSSNLYFRIYFCYVYRELKFSILFIFEKFIERTRGRCFISHHGQLLAYNLVVINNIAD